MPKTPGWTGKFFPSLTGTKILEGWIIGCDKRRSRDWKAWNCSVKLPTLMIPMPRDFQEFLQLLNAQGIKYLIIGGYAVAYHGYVRYTGDLDIFVALSTESASGLTQAVQEFGFDFPEVKPSLFLEKGKIIRMGHEPMRLEIFNDIDGVSFEECYQNREEVSLGELKVSFIALPQLLKNKQATGRVKDAADVSELTRKKL